MDLLLIAIVGIACVSLLLTLLHLWQIKEWRIDRLKEHIRSEGIIRQIMRMIRPMITLRQPRPVWTQKALTLFSTAILINLTPLVALWALRGTATHYILIFLPFLQPIILFLSWLLWLPVDRMLKRHILEEARALRAQYPDLVVIGITGSVGKTTTKELLAHILADFSPLVTPAYVNTEMGVATWLIQVLTKSPITKSQSPNNNQYSNPNTQILIVEMGAYRTEEIKTLCDIVQPTIGIITAIGTQHLGLFGSRDAIAQAKGELFEALPKNGSAFIPEGTRYIEELKKKAKCPVIVVHTEKTDAGLSLPASCLSLSLALARHLGLSPETIDQKIQSFTPPPHTFSLRIESGVTVLDDTHNVSPESFRAAIEWAKTQPQDYKVLITPGIIELGKEEAEIHRKLGEEAIPVFNRIIFLSKRYARMFQPLPPPLHPASVASLQCGARLPPQGGVPSKVEIYSKNINPIPKGSLLLCLGRMSEKTIKTLLP